MNKSIIYRPIIKWKAGEYRALKSLNPHLAARMFPLIQLVPPGFDFERKIPKTTIDGQLENVSDDYLKNWGSNSAAIDFSRIDQNERMANGQLPVEYIFDQFRKKNLIIIPVTTIEREESYQSAIASIIRNDGNGLCIRIPLAKAFNSQIADEIRELLTRLRVSEEHTDLVIDLGAPQNYLPIEGFASVIVIFLKAIFSIGDWRSLTVCGSSIPESMMSVSAPFTILPRHEWGLFKILRDLTKNLGRQEITFGDYGIVHPNQKEPQNPKQINLAAAIKYTIDDEWVIYRGHGLRKGKNKPETQSQPKSIFDEGYAQYFRLCREIINSSHYLGNEYSAGDGKIYTTAKLTEKETKNWTKGTGNSTTWIEAGMSHHFTKVLRDLSSLLDS